MLAIWSLVPLLFLKPAWTSGSSQFTYCASQNRPITTTTTTTSLSLHVGTVTTCSRLLLPLFWLGSDRFLKWPSFCTCASLAQPVGVMFSCRMWSVIFCSLRVSMGFPSGSVGKESICLRFRRHRRCRFDPWARKIPQRRKWQPTPVFLPGKSHGWRSLVDHNPMGHKESNMPERQKKKSKHSFWLSWLWLLSSKGTFRRILLFQSACSSELGDVELHAGLYVKSPAEDWNAWEMKVSTSKKPALP